MSAEFSRSVFGQRRLVFFALLVGMLLVATVFAAQICPYDPYAQDLAHALEAPSWAHPFGTDRFGRDLLSRVIVGAQTSIFSALVLVAVIAICGTLVGVLCAICGGVIDTLFMRVADVCLAFPGIVFALALAAVIDGGIWGAVLALAAVSWPKYARLARSQTRKRGRSSAQILSPRLGLQEIQRLALCGAIFCRTLAGRSLSQRCSTSAR